MDFYAVCIGCTKSVDSISNHVKIGSVMCLLWLPYSEIEVSQNSSEQSCDCLLFHSISVPKIQSILRTVNEAACWSTYRLPSTKKVKDRLIVKFSRRVKNMKYTQASHFPISIRPRLATSRLV
jgi:predicted Fe-S protein YdhL (DUF1289 family)